MFDILNVWNNTNKSITGEQNLNAFKRKILEDPDLVKTQILSNHYLDETRIRFLLILLA